MNGTKFLTLFMHKISPHNARLVFKIFRGEPLDPPKNARAIGARRAD